MPAPLFESSFLQETLQASASSPRSVTLSNGVQMSLLQKGVLKISPPCEAKQTRHIVISSAVHGNETAPIEMVDDLASQIASESIIPGHHLLLIIAHPNAILAEERFVETNLNRLFGDADYPQSQELTLAVSLKEQVTSFWQGVPIASRWHLDMHCSIRASKHYTFAISPQSTYPTRQKEFIDFMRKAGIEAVLLSEEPSSTFSWFSSSKFGAQAATLELGQVAKFGHNDMHKLAKFNRAFLELVESAEFSTDGDMITYQVDSSIYRQNMDFEFYFDKALPNFSRFTKGEELGKDGEKVLTMPVEQGGIVFPNPDVELNQRAALIVKSCATRYVDNQLTVLD
ncbi:succinylglutamate desuccinylase [Vibrio inusitatus NBRC 102082]|uniref:Succinylglutamate desuccinylase n=1 Tax=Vibrio inusitatus NBRC 102082 TaxID=1219070 RepID=A0A4Y3HXE9_9VIBR|nr:succinylglutamate desuccinylase [Vibrio inusitatus]GEA50944.1 succinylglutamate desuccinylase [Vibrio inusitatus NBRC 102082]